MHLSANRSLDSDSTVPVAPGRVWRLSFRACLVALSAFAVSACDASPIAPGGDLTPDQARRTISAGAPTADKPDRTAKKVRGKALVTMAGTPAGGGPAGVTDVRFTGVTARGAPLHGVGTVTGHRYDRRRELHAFMIDFRGTLDGRAIEGRGRFTADASTSVDGADFLIWQNQVVLSFDAEHTTDGDDL
jgi:hypothetical protein